MINKTQLASIKACVSSAKIVTILQGDNPDGDSLGSALGLGDILQELDKTVHQYCGVDVPKYLRYMPGYESVTNNYQKSDLIIAVDVSIDRLIEKGPTTSELEQATVIALDHHQDATMSGELIINDTDYAAAGQLIYDVASQLKWPITKQAATNLYYSIMSDTLGLVSPTTTAETVQVIADLVRLHGLSLYELDNARRELSRKSLEIIEYKTRLLQRTDYLFDNQVALTVIPLEEIQQYSDKYNPSALVSEELRHAEEVRLCIGLKIYEDKITGRLREIQNAPVCDTIAKSFDIGGGHPFASGFKVMTTDIDKVKKQVVKAAFEALEEYDS